MTVNRNFLSIKFVISLFFIVFFIFVIAYADKFAENTQELAVNSSFVGFNNTSSTDISLDEITSVQLDDNDKGVIKYTVQAGDSLGKIASIFGSTVGHIKQVNDISSAIRPGQTLVITDEEKGFVYELPEKTNIVVFANKYNLNLEDLMTLNYIQDETEILFEGSEIFINITDDQAIAKGLMDPPPPVIVKKASNRPVIIKPTGSSSRTSVAGTSSTRSSATKSSIISKWTYTKNISNRFARGYCTWYAAIISPNIFPYTSETTQSREFGGDAAKWCANAKAVGFRIGSTPAAGAIIVYKPGGGISYAGHVEKVISYYPNDSKMILEGMNYAGKFVVTRRWASSKDSRISCYIYGK